MLNLKRRNNIKIEIPKQPLEALKILEQAGFEAYIVGGCVRDSLLGIIPKDWDITTQANVDNIKKLFKKSFETGIKHGTITVLLDDMPIEITTYRVDGDYKDFRHPDQVVFTKSLEEDLSRRDFTINALAYHSEVGLVDLFSGMNDLKNGIIRTVGNADKRFNEDALRILRCVRFALRFGYRIEDQTYSSIRSNVGILNHIAFERIKEEMNNMLLCDGDLYLLHETGILSQILPELDVCFDITQENPRHNDTVGVHSLLAVKYIQKDLILRWTALLHDIGKKDCKAFDEEGNCRFYGHNERSWEIATNILNRFKFDNKSKSIILKLIRNHDISIDLTKIDVKNCIRKVGKDIFPLLLEHKRADAKAASPNLLDERLIYLDEVEQIYNNVKNDPIYLNELAVDGHDLQKLGISGRNIGFILNKLLDIVVKNPLQNDKQALILIAKEIWREYE